MRHLRDLSSRPRLLVDPSNRRVVGPDRTFVGRAGTLGRSRIVSALPTGGPPSGMGSTMLRAPRVVHSPQMTYLADPDGALIGDRPPIWVARMLDARWVEATNIATF